MDITTLEIKFDAVILSLSQQVGHDPTLSQSSPQLLEDFSLPHLKTTARWFISGMSGVGKSTLASTLEQHGFKKIPNITTRRKRSNEHEADYRFVTEEQFIHLQSQNLLCNPHKRNGVWHAIALEDIENLTTSTQKIYMDKSISSTRFLVATFKPLRTSTFIYLLPTSMSEVYERIIVRQQSLQSGALTETEIYARLTEELDDLRQAIHLPYVYIVNDSLIRVQKMVRSVIDGHL